MFELTNEQRKCFALPPVLDTWKKIEVKPSPYDLYDTYVYLDGQKIMKVIQIYEEAGHPKYYEYSVDQMISEDGKKLLPKTAKGKPQNFISSHLERKPHVGMALYFERGFVCVTNNTAEQSYYRSAYEGIQIQTLDDFRKWLDDWCEHTGEKELAEIETFANKTKIHQKYKEGDFFRYKINRSLYGYGRILLNFDKMRKEGIPFWNIFMGKPLCIGIYHIVTENPNLTPEQLAEKKMLPSHMIMDNIFFYGECEIIGNLPIDESKTDYPIHYGQSIGMLDPHCVHYQCGKTFLTLQNTKALYDFRNGSIGWNLDVELPILYECIKENSNDPYWRMIHPYSANQDLRNPKFKNEWEEIKKQMGIP